MSTRTQTGCNYRIRPLRMKHRMRTRPLVSFMRAQTTTSLGEPSLEGSEGCLHPAYTDDNIIQGKQCKQSRFTARCNLQRPKI